VICRQLWYVNFGRGHPSISKSKCILTCMPRERDYVLSASWINRVIIFRGRGTLTEYVVVCRLSITYRLQYFLLLYCENLGKLDYMDLLAHAAALQCRQRAYVLPSIFFIGWLLRSKGKVTRPWKSEIWPFSKLSPPRFTMRAGKWPRIFKLGTIPTAYRGRIFDLSSRFLCHVSLNLARSVRCEESILSPVWG